MNDVYVIICTHSMENQECIYERTENFVKIKIKVSPEFFQFHFGPGPEEDKDESAI